MKYLKSYPCEYKDINKLPLDALEKIMTRIGEAPYLNEADKSELLYQWYSILPGSSGFLSYQAKDLESNIEEDVVWGENLKDETPEQRSWGCIMNLDREKCKEIRFCWAFHNLLDFVNFSMDDILKIKEFKIEMEANYEHY